MCREFKCYLAGAMTGLTFGEMNQWRVEAKNKLNSVSNLTGVKIYALNPVDFYNFDMDYQSEEEVMDFDLQHIGSSDFVLLNLKDVNKSIGTAMELKTCWDKHIPVVAFGSEDDIKNLHPWIKRIIRRIEKDMSSAVAYIEDYMLI